MGRNCLPCPHQTLHPAPSLNLRAIEIDGEPWFAAADVCSVLDTATRDVRAIVDSDDICNRAIPGRRGRAAVFVNESGLYCLLLKSRKPEARDFKRWVTKEVLPAIRRNGG
ncbi:BRO family protein [Variovorax robiniae]|uniref:BRO family protein n=1 Tax=Variovorax robiniae TaxID=1836199 RepID=A0ABU8XJT9_9BURK